MADLFEVIEAATAAHAAGPADMGRALGMVFQAPAPGSNDVFEIAESQRSRSVDELTAGEMRVRRSSRAVRILILDVDRRVRCVAEREVVARYGPPKDLSFPRPTQPAGSPTYSLYPRPWGELRVGIADGCVVSVVAEFHEQSH